MIYSKKKYPFVVAGILLFILVLILLNQLWEPLLTIKTYSEVLPKEKWMLTRGNNGQIISSLIDYRKGHTTRYSLNQFERGEFVSLDFKLAGLEGKYIQTGDTLVNISSSFVEDQILSEETDLAVAEASLKSLSAGQKESMIDEAKNRLSYTIEKIKEQRILVDRTQKLFDKGIVSQQELDAQKWLLDLLVIEEKIFKSQLESISTGVKTEELKLAENQLEAIKRKLAFLKDRKRNLVIVSPLDGYLTPTFSPDTLVTIVNTNKVILHTAVKQEDLNLVNEKDTVSFSLAGIMGIFKGEIIAISKEVKVVNGQQVIFASIEVENRNNALIPGMVLETNLQLKRIKFIEYILRGLFS